MRALRVLALALVALGTSACLRPYPVEEPVPDAGVDAGLPDSEVSLFHPMPGASASLTFLTTPALAGHVFVANANQLWSWPASQGAPAGSTAPFEIAPGSFSGAPIAALVPGDYGAIVVTRGASSFRLSLAPGDASLIEETTVDGTTGEIAGTRNRVATSLGLYVRATNQ